MIEVEIRGPLTNEELSRVNNFLETNAEKLQDFEELAIFYHSEGKHEFPIGAIRIKKDDKSEKIVFKSFDIGAQQINKEINVLLKDGEYKNAIKLLNALGIKSGDVTNCHRKDFKYNGIEITLKENHMLGTHFEMEKTATSEKEVDAVLKELKEFADEFNLRLWEGNEYTVHRDKVLKEIGGPVNVFEKII